MLDKRVKFNSIIQRKKFGLQEPDVDIELKLLLLSPLLSKLSLYDPRDIEAGLSEGLFSLSAVNRSLSLLTPTCEEQRAPTRCITIPLNPHAINKIVFLSSLIMCYYRLYIFLHCGHSTFSEMPVGFCKAAKDVTVRFSGSRQRSTSTASNTSSVYSRTDSMDAEERKRPQSVSTTRAIRPCIIGRIHPLQTRKLERLCSTCQHERDKRLEALELLNNGVHFEPWQGQSKYQSGRTYTQQKEARSNMESTTAWDVTATINSLVSGSSSWIKDWKRQESTVADRG
jgi:hypothetical protein